MKIIKVFRISECLIARPEFTVTCPQKRYEKNKKSIFLPRDSENFISKIIYLIIFFNADNVKFQE